MAPSGKKGKNSQEKISRLCAKSWWKLRKNDRTRHNEAMKIQLLSPFLYRKIYQNDVWINWAKSSGLLTDSRLIELNELTNEELMYIDLIELAVCYLQDKIQDDFIEKSSQNSNTLEDVIDNIDKYQKETQFTTVITRLRNESWFQSVRSQLIKCPVIDIKIHNKCDAAILLVAWQVSQYMKAMYQGEPLLMEYEENKSFDSESEKIKEIGNVYFKQNKLEQAIITYTNILYNKPYVHIVYCNRAICFIRKQKYRAALADGRRCVTLDPTWFKGQMRYAEALFELGYWIAALEVLQKARDICEDPGGHLIKFLNEIRNKIDANNKERSLSSCSKFPCSKDENKERSDDEDDYDNDNGSDGVPDLLTDSEDDNSYSDYEDFEGRKLDSSNRRLVKTDESKPKKPLLSYMVGALVRFDRNIGRTKKQNSYEAESDLDKDPMTKSFKMSMEKASKSLLYPGKYDTIDPVQKYQEAKDLLDKHTFSKVSMTTKVLLYYAHAVSYLETKKRKYVEKSIHLFDEIIKKYSDVIFPLPHYGKGKAYVKMRRFDNVDMYFNQALRLDAKSGCLKSYTWPGTNVLIEESSSLGLKKAIDSLTKQINKNIPPDADCSSVKCIAERRQIYFDDLDFKGFYRVHCEKKHQSEFHKECWQDVDFRYTKSLKRYCLVEKCDSCISLIELLQDGVEPTIEFKDENFKHLTSGPAASPKSKKKKKNKNINNNTNSITDTTSTPLLPNTSNEGNKENSQPSQTSKSKKKKKKNNGSTSGTDSPDTIRRNASYKIYSQSMEPGFDFNQYDNTVKTHMFELYFFAETLLSVQPEPFINLFLNRPLQEYSQIWDLDFSRFMAVNGGIPGVLSKCNVFGVDEKQFGMIYLKTREIEYQNFKSKQSHTLYQAPPECQDVLFSTELQKIKNFSNLKNVHSIGDKKAIIKDSRLEINEINEDDDEDDDSPPSVTINVGVQVDIPDTEKENKEKHLTELNKKLLSEIKVLRKDKAQMENDSKKKNKVILKYEETIVDDETKLQVLRKEKKALIQETLRYQEEIKKLRELSQSKDELIKRTEKLRKEEMVGVKNELDDVRSKLSKGEEFIEKLHNNFQEEGKRTEKVEIALLESRRDLVVIKYQQQAQVIQNTINQMQFLSHLPEMVHLRKLWEDYKIEYQTSYEKMQEEFSGFIQSVRLGKRLESLPPSKYSHPPPYPQSPMQPQPSQGHQTHNGTNNGLPLPTPHMMVQTRPTQPRPRAPLKSGILNTPPQPFINGSILGQAPSHPPFASQPPMDIAAQLQAIIKPPSESRQTSNSIPTASQPTPTVEQSTNDDVTQHGDDKEDLQPVAQAAYSTQQPHLATQQQLPHSDSDDSEASSRTNEKDDFKYNKFFEKVIMKLGSKFPTAPRDELLHFFNEYRKQGPLSGHKIDDIVSNIEHLIRRKRRKEVLNPSRNLSTEKKKVQRVQGAGALNHGGVTKRQRANQVSAKTSGYGGGNIFGLEEPCVICYEDMQANNALLLHCGHTFHRECIHCWLKEQRTCPVCRVLALLPDEYPALG